MPNMIGLDIGTHSIKASIFEGSFGRYNFVRTEQEMLPTTDDALEERQGEAIASLLRRIEKGEFVSAISAQNVSIRKLDTPFTDISKIELALPSLIEELVPFDIEDITLAHHLIHADADGSTIVALITPTEQIAAHLASLSEFDISPTNIMVDADILSCYATAGNQALLNIGSETTICSLYKDGKTLTFRTLTEGLNDTENLTELPERLLSRIRHSLIQFEDQFDLEIDEVLIAGGGANLGDVVAQLHEELGVPIQKVHLPNNLDPQFALSYALGLKAIGETHGREFDLRTGDFAYQGNFQRIMQAVQIAAVISLLAFVGCAGWFFTQSAAKNKALTQAEENIKTEVRKTLPDLPDSVLSTPSTVISLIQEDLESANQKLSKLGSITSDVPPTLNMLKEISEGMPPHEKARIDVKEMMISKTTINIKAETDGFQTATEIETALKQNPRFKQAKKADEKSLRNGISFSIIIPLEIQNNDTEEEG